MTPGVVWQPRRNKYHARACEVDGHRFASQKEARRYQELRLLERAGTIQNLQPQFRLPLLAHGPDGPVPVGYYLADFYYLDLDCGVEVLEDVKSPATRRLAAYRLKKRLVEATYGITITEV